jgi:hypothetical protein
VDQAVLSSLAGHSPYDWRLAELRRLGALERRLAAEMLDAQDAIAQLVKQLLPHHATEARINAVVEASGYSRTLIEAIRGSRDVWSKRGR